METIFVFKVSCCTFAPIMREKILSNAAELFLNYGFKSITMDDISNHIGISKKPYTSILRIKQRLLKQ